MVLFVAQITRKGFVCVSNFLMQIVGKGAENLWWWSVWWYSRQLVGLNKMPVIGSSPECSHTKDLLSCDGNK